nr:DNA double-strand break repair nuclease NurA [Candidatus Freyrarchaeum guaymaensis]
MVWLLGEAYELALRNVSYLKEKASRVELDSWSVEETWVNAGFSGGFNGSVAGVDGGRNWVECRDFVLYVVDAEAVVFTDGEEGESVRMVDVDVLYPHRHVEDRIASYSEILEGKAAYMALRDRKVDRVFMDGSLIGVLIRPPFRGYASLRERGFERHAERVVNSWDRMLDEAVFSKRMLEEVVCAYGEMGGAAASFLESAEKLLVYRRLLEDYGDRLVFVSKTSRGCDYFKSFKSDISIFNEFTRRSGYSKPLHLEISRKAKWRFPVFDDFFRGLTVTVFYARLEDRGPVLRFEVPGCVEGRVVEEVLVQASTYSVLGYPYPLRKAHMDVKVSDDEIERVFRIVGFYEAERGREFLE